MLSGGIRVYAETVNTFDDFSTSSGTTFDSAKWNVLNNTSFFSVVSNSGTFGPYQGQSGSQGNMLEVSGTGSAGYPGSKIQADTGAMFAGGSFIVAINFRNFSYTGTPGAGDSKYPNVNIMVGDYSANPFFVVSRAYNSSGNVIGWNEYTPDGTSSLYHGAQSYSSDSGGLAVLFQQNGQTKPSGSPNPYMGYQVSLGYYTSSDPMGYGLSTFHSLYQTDAFFNGAPQVRIGANGGSTGTLRADVGGLFSTQITIVPIPAGIFLLAPGLAGLLVLKRKYIG